jgi:hypothetical protein
MKSRHILCTYLFHRVAKYDYDHGSLLKIEV